MRTSVVWMAVALWVLGIAVLPGAASSKVWIEVEDPANDDTGDGDYTYPTDPNFGDGGQADLTYFKIETVGEVLRFTLAFRDLVDPWSVGNRLTFVAIAIDNGKGGLEELGHGAFARLAAPAEYVIYCGGGVVELTDADGVVLRSKAAARVDVDTDTLVIDVPIDEIGRPGKRWRYTIAAGLQDDYGAGGIGDFRLVNGEAAQWRGGGGDDLAIDPNVYDLVVRTDRKLLKRLAPETGSQSEILGNYSLEENRLVVLPYIKR